MKQLYQKIYRLRTDTGNSPKAKTVKELNAVIDGIETDISIEKFFEKHSISDGYIKGWSILQDLNPKNSQYELLNNEHIVIFIHPETRTTYRISKIENPGVIFNDITITTKKFNSLLELMNTSAPLNADTSAPLSTSTSELEENSSSEEPPVSEEPAELKIYEISDETENDIQSLKDDGYSQDREGNVIKLTKEDEPTYTLEIQPDGEYKKVS